MKRFTAAVAQTDLKNGDKNSNLDRACEIMASAAERGADLICLPEYLTTGSPGDVLGSLAEPIPGDTTKTLGSAAREHGLYASFSMAERDGDAVFNTGVLVGPSGDVLGTHRKMHLFLDEREHVTPGHRYTVVDTDLGKLGLMVCYDTVFPEVARNLAIRGAEVILVPSNWPDPYEPQWNLATAARAFDNQVWLVAANRLGTGQDFTYFGGSRIVDPTGKAVVASGNKEGIFVGTIDPSVTKSFTDTIDFMSDRKEVYGL